MSASIVILMTSNLQKENSSKPVSSLEVKGYDVPIHEGAAGVRWLLQGPASKTLAILLG